MKEVRILKSEVVLGKAKPGKPEWRRRETAKKDESWGVMQHHLGFWFVGAVTRQQVF